MTPAGTIPVERPGPPADPMLPAAYRISRVRRETHDTRTLEIDAGDRGFPFAPGQFNMLYAFGKGEVPISISGDPARPERLVHTVRAVGAVSRAPAISKAGEMLGVRGPFGTHWPMRAAETRDVVLVAGGIGIGAVASGAVRPARRPRAIRPDRAALRGPHAGRPAVPRRVAPLGRGRRSRARGHRRQRRRRLARARGGGDHPAGEGRVRPRLLGGHGLRARGHDAIRGAGPARLRHGPCRRPRLDGAQHEVRRGPLRPLPVRTGVRLQGRTGPAFDRIAHLIGRPEI